LRARAAVGLLIMRALVRHGERAHLGSILVLALAALAAACGGGHGRAQRPAKARRAAGHAQVNPHYGAPGASVSFVDPKEGATISQPVHVRVLVRGFKLDPAGLDKAPRRGRGELLFRMDGGRFDTPRYAGANGNLAQRLGIAGKFSPALSPEITYRDLPRGRHTLLVFLANNDLSQTGVQAQLVFSVR
jgi:hypothetical protein